MPTFSNTPRPAYVYEAATDQWIPVGFGPHTHAVTDVTNAFNTTTVTTKGDLVVAAGSNNITRLAAGANGESLVADSTTTTGLRWQNTFAAGRNVIINGDFGIWQRGTSFTGASNVYTSDRWVNDYFDGTPSFTVARQTFTPGAAPVAGYEGNFFLRQTISTTGGATVLNLTQKIEDARTLAGQTVTLSFWAKADSNRALNLVVFQSTGTGGSGGTTNLQSVSLTTAWQRFTWTFNIGSLSGATMGANSYVQLTFRQTIAAGSVLDIWGVQLEAGSVASAFETASGSIGGELALCQRYYTTSIPTDFTIANFSGMNQGSSSAIGWCSSGSTNDIFTTIQYPVPMRAAPTFVIYSAGNRTAGSVRDAVTGSDLAVGNYSVQAGNNKGFNYMTGFTATTGRPYSFQWTASAEI
ncbi:hypothetical protein UFOVP696_25 [uncultured Caudovirales phage]|uniref:Uncharacterized protein n=1 Tax=uncultured Caudovirales phage TaxID=2100421 RepID=A0A6J5MX12_9CAUD|nr:hypothetical protein UFOVP429_142 [uncultured Caudovirales phage]CAB4158143.1 hypothetical protein UFOVP696_25 [uncultured Caudovirales phage]